MAFLNTTLSISYPIYFLLSFKTYDPRLAVPINSSKKTVSPDLNYPSFKNVSKNSSVKE